jgi:plasmid stability protein
MTRMRDMVQVQLHLPKAMLARLKRAAAKHYTSLNVEVIDKLTAALDYEDGCKRGRARQKWWDNLTTEQKMQEGDRMLAEATTHLLEHTDAKHKDYV